MEVSMGIKLDIGVDWNAIADDMAKAVSAGAKAVLAGFAASAGMIAYHSQPEPPEGQKPEPRGPHRGNG
jgi:hypothetical protein